MNALCPFLYPFSKAELAAFSRFSSKYPDPSSSSSSLRSNYHRYVLRARIPQSRLHSTDTLIPPSLQSTNALPITRLNPTPDDYSITPFVDKTVLIIQSGNGGNGCVSFLREKYIAEGPANGGNGGYGGNIFIQAVRNCNSLNLLSKQRHQRAGDGGHGMGRNRGGKQGKDILLQVPVGTVVREVRRWDPISDVQRWERIAARPKRYGEEEAAEAQAIMAKRWILYPGLTPSQKQGFESFPELPPVRRAALAAMEPTAPIALDLSFPMRAPQLLAAGAPGGVGNPHFVSQGNGRPKVATRGDQGMRIALALELKLVADVGLVGMPNVGKSTFLRSISASRARVGNWAFTTLMPNIGTVVLDDHKARSMVLQGLDLAPGTTRTRLTVADIPGLIEDAHMNKGLGLEFLRHVERAKILAFVLDLGAGDAVQQLVALWTEIGAYQALKNEQKLARYQSRATTDPFTRDLKLVHQQFESITTEDIESLPPLQLPAITQKPWFVIATKADKDNTQENFLALRDYVQRVASGSAPHPSGDPLAVNNGACVTPVSAIKGEGMGRVINVVLELLGN